MWHNSRAVTQDAQKGKTSHPPQPRRAETRLVPSKAAGESKPEEVPTALRGAGRPYMDLGERKNPSSTSDLRESLRYVEDFNESRTTLADFFSILLETD